MSCVVVVVVVVCFSAGRNGTDVLNVASLFVFWLFVVACPVLTSRSSTMSKFGPTCCSISFIAFERLLLGHASVLAGMATMPSSPERWTYRALLHPVEAAATTAAATRRTCFIG